MTNFCNIEDFADLNVLTIDKTKPREERLLQYICEVKNPYMVRVGDMPVQIEFTGGKSIADAFAAALENKGVFA